jgi:hypothetical protein
MARIGDWTADEIATLRRDYGSCRNADLAARLGRTKNAIQKKAASIGLMVHKAPSVRWTPELRALLRAKWLTMTSRALAKEIGCSRDALMKRAQIDRLPRKGPGPTWPADEARLALRLIGTAPSETIARAIGRSQRSVRRLAERAAGGVYEAVAQRELGHERDLQRLRILLAHARGMLTIVEAAAALGVSYAEVSQAMVMEAVAGAGLAPQRREAGR